MLGWAPCRVDVRPRAAQPPRPGVRTIARSPRFRPQQRETGKRLRINDQIRISPVRLIDENDEQVGVVDIEEARRRARDAGLDLVEVSGTTRPPVVKVMDYGKWKYAQAKKEQKAKSHAKKSELKGMRLRPNIDDHDLDLKVKKAREFLEDGDKVQFVMLFRGRQMAHKDLARDTMLRVFKEVEDVGKIEQDPKMMGRRMTMLLTPDRKGAKGSKGEAGEETGGETAAGGTVAAPVGRPPRTLDELRALAAANASANDEAETEAANAG